MWHQIAVNKRNSIILLFLMLVLLLAMGAVLAVAAVSSSVNPAEFINYNEMLLNSAMIGCLVSFLVWIILLLSSLINGKNTILSLNHAYKLPTGAYKVVENVVEEMTIAAGLPKRPQIYVIDTLMPNAFATGLSPDNAAIAVTTGLLTELDRTELQGVVAHEISHIANRDTMYMIFAGVMIGTILILADAGVRVFARTSSRRSSSRGSSSGGGGGPIVLLCLIFMILSPIIAKLLYFSISQKREYLADACAAQYTRYPMGLALALSKISSSQYNYLEADKVTSAMYIVNPLEAQAKNVHSRSMFSSLFSTHPPVEKRIEVLTKMTSADIGAYNSAFSQVSGKKATILSKEDLLASEKLQIQVPNDKKNQNLSIMEGLAIASSLAAIDSNPEVDKKQKSEHLDRKRAANDIIWRAENYIFKQCECGTKLKFPKEYEGMQMECPHCKKMLNVVNDFENQ